MPVGAEAAPLEVSEPSADEGRIMIEGAPPEEAGISESFDVTGATNVL